MVFIITDHSKIVPEEEAVKLDHTHLSPSFFEFLAVVSRLNIQQGWLRIKFTASGGGEPKGFGPFVGRVFSVKKPSVIQPTNIFPPQSSVPTQPGDQPSRKNPESRI